MIHILFVMFSGTVVYLLIRDYYMWQHVILIHQHKLVKTALIPSKMYDIEIVSKCSSIFAAIINNYLKPFSTLLLCIKAS